MKVFRTVLAVIVFSCLALTGLKSRNDLYEDYLFREDEEWEEQMPSKNDETVRTLIANINFLMTMHDNLKDKFNKDYDAILRTVSDLKVRSATKVVRLTFFLDKLKTFLYGSSR